MWCKSKMKIINYRSDHKWRVINILELALYTISTCYYKLNLNIINVSNTDILFIILPKVSFHLFINPYFARYLVIHIILLYLTCWFPSALLNPSASLLASLQVEYLFFIFILKVPSISFPLLFALLKIQFFDRFHLLLDST